MSAIPLNPPSFFWNKQKDPIDAKVCDWICPMQNVKAEAADGDWDVVLFGVPLSRSSISPSGASEFPDAFRRSWKSFSTYSIDYDIDLLSLKVADAGDVQMHFTDIPLCHTNIKQAMKGIRRVFPKALPIGIGGDHSITAMLVAGQKELEPDCEIGILQFDTHLDLRDLKDHGPTNGTPIRYLIDNNAVKGQNVYNIGLHGFFNGQSLIKYAKEKGVNVTPLREARKQGVENAVKKAAAELERKVDLIYVTVDMDVLDIAFAPGVPASTAGGMRTDELFEAVYTAGLTEKVMAMDIVCLDPTRDGSAQPTVKAGTCTFLSFLTGLVNRTRSVNQK